MGRHPLAFTAEQPIAAEQAALSLANVVPFNRRGRLLAKLERITSARSSKTVTPPPSATTEGDASGWHGPKCIIIDFARADLGGHATKGHKFRSNENETSLTVTDYAAIAYVLMAVAFYPGLAWLFSP